MLNIFYYFFLKLRLVMIYDWRKLCFPSQFFISAQKKRDICRVLIQKKRSLTSAGFVVQDISAK